MDLQSIAFDRSATYAVWRSISKNTKKSKLLDFRAEYERVGGEFLHGDTTMFQVAVRLCTAVVLAILTTTPSGFAEDAPTQERIIHSQRHGPLLKQNEIIETFIHEVNSGKYNISRVGLKLDNFGFLEAASIVYFDGRGTGNNKRVRIYYPEKQTPEAIGSDIASIIVKERPVYYRVYSIDEPVSKRVVFILFYFQIPPSIQAHNNQPPPKGGFS
jgi:hypothetical protein